MDFLMEHPIPINIFNNSSLTAEYSAWQGDRWTGMVRSVAEFARFTRRNDLIDHANGLNGSDQHIATVCGHSLHPRMADDSPPAYCPVRDVNTYFDILHMLTEAWDSIGGPWGSDSMTRSTYYAIRSAWHATRQRLEGHVNCLQGVTDNEARWEIEHPLEAETARKTHSATHTIASTRNLLRYPASIQPPKNMATSEPSLNSPNTLSATPKMSSTIAAGKKVTFSEDTKFEKGRSNEFFDRASSVYEQGAHAASPGCELIDASGMEDLLWAIGQLKVVTTDTALDSLQRLYNGIWVETHEGIAANHPRWSEIVDRICQHSNHPDATIRQRYQERLHYADFLLLNLDENKNIATVPAIRTQEIEDIEEALPEGYAAVVRSRAWTSHQQVLPDGVLNEISNSYNQSGRDDSFSDDLDTSSSSAENNSFLRGGTAVSIAPIHVESSVVIARKRSASEAFTNESDGKRVR